MGAQQVAIIDGGGANIASLQFALQRLGADNFLTRDAAKIRSASHVILPGVGAARDAMTRLREANLDEVIADLTQPILGICLGMQLLAQHSIEDDTQCLGLLQGTVTLLPSSPDFPVPNMGWCQIDKSGFNRSDLMRGIDTGSWFYFVHSYALGVQECTVATANHSIPFTAVLQKQNFYATQFHPERSGKSGARILRNFLALAG